jgi:hypothetical protein
MTLRYALRRSTYSMKRAMKCALMQRATVKRALLAAGVGVVLCTGPAAAAWGPGGSFFVAQGQKGRPGPAPGGERAERPRDMRQDRQEEQQRRERMTEDERRSLHRDLDKANREIYGRRPPK